MSHARELERDVGSMLWVGFDGVHVPRELRARIAAGRVGAVVLFARNLAPARAGRAGTDVGALAGLVRALHDAVPAGAPPLLVAMDQEGGRVQRLRAPATVWPPMASFAQVGDAPRAEQLAFDVGEAVGAELAAVGVDVDFAPVLDVHTRPDNPVIGDRAFASDARQVARCALAFARGLEHAGVIACGKHFPGHGDTVVDSHLALPRIDHARPRLDTVELVPFARAAAAGLSMIMTAHVVVAALDDTRPATLSPQVIEGVLRGELGYRGVIVSDDLDMGAIRACAGAATAAVAAVEAGCDALLLCADQGAQHEAFDALVGRALDEHSFRVRVATSAARVRALARRHGARRSASWPAARAVLGCARHRSLAAELAGAGDGGATARRGG